MSSLVSYGSSYEDDQPRSLASQGEGDYRQLVAVLMRQRNWLLGITGGVVAATLLGTLLVRPTYQSSMQLLVEPNYQSKREPGDSQTTESQFADPNVQVDSATQLNVMRSSLLLQRAVKLLAADYPDLTVEKLRKSLTVNQVEQKSSQSKVKTKIYEVGYQASDPEEAQQVLKAMQKVYQNYNLEQQKLRLSRGLAFINEQLPQALANVRRAEADLERFREKQNLIDPELQAKTMVDALNTVQQEQRKNQAELQQTLARYQALQQQLARSPQGALTTARLSQSSRYQTLLNEIQKTELSLAQNRLRFQDNAPVIENLLAQRQSQRQLLQQEVGRVLGADAARFQREGERLLQEGQFGETDQTLSNNLVEAMVDVRSLRAQQQSLARSEQQLLTRLNSFPRLIAEYNRLQPEVEIQQQTLQELLKARQELGLEIARGGFDWQVVEEPTLGWQVSPNLKLNLLLAGIAGLMLGALVAFVRDGMDDAVYSTDELTKQASLPLLGIVPQMEPLLPSQGQPQSLSLPFRRSLDLNPDTRDLLNWPPFRESLDLLYQNLQLLGRHMPLRSLVMTSALAGEGKSTLALGLALSAARLHQRVLLIDADLRRPNLHKLLGLSNQQGLSTLLAEDASLPALDHLPIHTLYRDLFVLTAGPIPEDPTRLLSSRRMGELMSMIKGAYDLVILDAPPMLGIADGMLAASFCDGVMMVGRMGQVTRAELNQSMRMLNKLNVVGIVANGANTPTYGYGIYNRDGLTIR